MKLTQQAISREQKLNILSYNPGLKTEFHISCSNLPKTILDFAKLCILPDFYPNLPIFLHGYIRHIRDISQLCIRVFVLHTLFRLSGMKPQNMMFIYSVPKL